MISFLIRKTRRFSRGPSQSFLAAVAAPRRLYPAELAFGSFRGAAFLALAVGGFLAACSDTPRRLGPGEIYRQKRELVLRHRHELTARQRRDFMYQHVLGATQTDLEETMEKEVEAYHRKQRQEQALLEERKRRASEMLAAERSDGKEDREEAALDLDRLSQVLLGRPVGDREDREE